MDNSEANLQLSSPFRFLSRQANKVIIPGMDGASLYVVSRFFGRKIRTMRIQERAAAVTYNFLMAMPPSLLFLFSLVPYLPLKNVEQTILNTLKLITPNQKIYLSVRHIVSDFMNSQHKDVLSYGLILVLFFSSNGMMGLMRTFDNSMAAPVIKRTGLQRRWTAVKLTIMLIGVTIIALSVLVTQTKQINKFLLKTFHTVLAVKIASFLILVLVVFIAISLIYRYGPSLTQRFRFVSAGSVFATIMSITTTFVFFFIVNHFINYNKVYGSIGSLIAFMVWLWLNTIIILLGYELNVSILLGKLSREDNDEED